MTENRKRSIQPLAAAHADVFESHGAQPHGVEQVLCVYDERPFQQVFDAVEIQPAKFRPARAHHQRIHAFGGGIGGSQ